jgi:hypothetical protein
MFGERSSGTVKATRGILSWITSEGIINTYSSAAGVAESDLQDHIRDLIPEGGSNEYLVLCGIDFLKNAQKALKDYAIQGAISYGSLGKNMAGLDFAGYKFLGKTIYFAYYELFSDRTILPYTGTPSSSKINFDDFSLWLDLGSTNTGEKLIKLRYKAHGGVSRKFIQKTVPGMVSFGGADYAAHTGDYVEIALLSEIAVEVHLANRMGILRANS